MKLRAPRCSDSVLWISAPECSSGIPSSWAMAVPVKKTAILINTQLLIMSRDPFRHRLHAVELRVPGHQQKESKVKNRAHSGQHRVDARRRLHAADSQGDE